MPTTHTDAKSLQTYARIAGILFLITMVAGGFGEYYAPTTLIVQNDATATAANIVAHDLFFRMGFAAYLVEGICDTALSLVFYRLLRPVQKDVALLAAFFGLVSTAVFAVCELFYFAPSFILGGADYLKTFSPDQLNSLSLLSLKFYGVGGMIFLGFYGIATGIRAYLIYHSGYLPRFLGVIMGLAGVGFVLKNLTVVLAPAYASDFFILPMMVSGLTLTVWMLVKGVDVRKVEARAAIVG